MKLAKFFPLTALLGMALILQFSGCQEGAISPVTSGGSELSDDAQIRKLIEEDEVLNSFEANYNEEEAMSLLGGTLAKTIYPVRVGHHMKLVNKSINIEVGDDTAFAHVENTFEGLLFIAASFEQFQPTDTDVVDTIIAKPFSTVMTHNVIFARRNDWGFNFFGNPNGLGDGHGGEREPVGGDGNVHGQGGNDSPDGNTNMYRKAWKIVAVSLVEGGTGSPNIVITKLTLVLPDGEEIVVESPNDYYLSRMAGRPDQIPSFFSGASVLAKVELQSAYADTDFVCITFGARHDGRYNRRKKCMELISEEFDGQYYTRTYEMEWVSRPDRGAKHAVVNAVPKQVIFDDETDVEAHSWGIPYIVK